MMMRMVARMSAGCAAAALPLAVAGCMATAGSAAAPYRQVDMAAHAFTSAVDNAEVQQAMLAQSRSQNQAVRDFASRMIADHSTAFHMREMRMEQLGMGLLSGSSAFTQDMAMSGGMNGDMTMPAAGSGSMGASGAWYLTSAGNSALMNALLANPISRPVAEAAPGQLQQLASLSGAQFDRGYMDAQVSAHQYALQNLDRMLQTGGMSPEMTATMRNVRATVASHLQMAQQLRSQMM